MKNDDPFDPQTTPASERIEDSPFSEESTASDPFAPIEEWGEQSAAYENREMAAPLREALPKSQDYDSEVAPASIAEGEVFPTSSPIEQSEKHDGPEEAQPTATFQTIDPFPEQTVVSAEKSCSDHPSESPPPDAPRMAAPFTIPRSADIAQTYGAPHEYSDDTDGHGNKVRSLAGRFLTVTHNDRPPYEQSNRHSGSARQKAFGRKVSRGGVLSGTGEAAPSLVRPVALVLLAALIVFGAFSLTIKVSSAIAYEVDSIFFTRSLRVPPPGLHIRGTKIIPVEEANGSKTFVVSGEIVNSTATEFSNIAIEGAVYDDEGTLVARAVSEAGAISAERYLSERPDNQKVAEAISRVLPSPAGKLTGPLPPSESAHFVVVIDGATESAKQPLKGEATWFSARVFTVKG